MNDMSLASAGTNYEIDDYVPKTYKRGHVRGPSSNDRLIVKNLLDLEDDEDFPKDVYDIYTRMVQRGCRFPSHFTVSDFQMMLEILRLENIISRQQDDILKLSEMLFLLRDQVREWKRSGVPVVASAVAENTEQEEQTEQPEQSEQPEQAEQESLSSYPQNCQKENIEKMVDSVVSEIKEETEREFSDFTVMEQWRIRIGGCDDPRGVPAQYVIGNNRVDCFVNSLNKDGTLTLTIKSSMSQVKTSLFDRVITDYVPGVPGQKYKLSDYR